MPIMTCRNIAACWREDGVPCAPAYLMSGQGPCGRMHPVCGHDGRCRWVHYPEYFKCDVHLEDWMWQQLGRCPLTSQDILPFVKKWMHLTRLRLGEHLLQGLTQALLCCVDCSGVQSKHFQHNCSASVLFKFKECHHLIAHSDDSPKCQSLYLQHLSLLQVRVWPSATTGSASLVVLGGAETSRH